MNLPDILRSTVSQAQTPAASQQHQAGIYLGWGTKGPVRARPDQHLLVLGPPDRG
jgi:hypothetical protein